MAAHLGLRSFVAAARCAPPPLLTALRSTTLSASSFSGSSRVGINSAGITCTRSLFTAAPVRAAASIAVAPSLPPSAAVQPHQPPARPFSILGLLQATHRSLSSRQRRAPSLRPSNNNASGPSNFLTPYLRRLDRMPSDWIFWGVLGLNTFIFAVWYYAQETLRLKRDGRLYSFMVRNFLSAESNLREGRVWTLVTACFTHLTSGPFFIDMLSLFFMGLPVLNLLGPVKWLSLYMGAGLASSFGSIVWNHFASPRLAPGGQMQRRAPAYTHGASGAVSGIMTTFACMAPNTKFLLMFVVPVPAWACIAGFFALDLLSSFTAPGARADGAGRMSGIIAGFLFWRYRMGSPRLM